ncbi:MAG: matrixin family metalloprotease, partial [Bdellovibrionales bacterium]|nr:matrixin family metalloprotease [Bdellovibrionales bacterium]
MFFNFNKKRAREVVVAFFLCLLLGPDGVAFVRTRADVGTKISWPSWQTTIPLIIYLDGYHGLDSSSLQSSLVAAASQWSNDNHTQSLSLYLGSNRNDARIEQSDLLFTTNMNYFGGSGVLAVTQVAYEGHNGEIVAADIFINDNLSFKLGETPDDGRYNLESVITHEMGHMMGLGHGQVRSSTMYYQLFSGQ